MNLNDLDWETYEKLRKEKKNKAEITIGEGLKTMLKEQLTRLL